MPTDRIFNFSAGPAVLPEPVLRKAQEAIWNVAGSGIGIMEHSHRGKVFDKIRDEAEQDCRDLAGISDAYEVLFLQGGASLQFSMVPMNLLPADRTADYLLTGVWAQKAVKEAKILGCKVHLAASSEATNFDRIPAASEIKYSASPGYVHLTTNNTIYGTQWRSEPPVPSGVPLVADTSSDMYSRPLDIDKYGLIYAGAQKNLGPSGLVLVIIRKDLVEAGRQDPAHHAAVPHPCGGEIALQHPADLRDLLHGAGLQMDQGGRAASRRWRSTTRARRSCSTTTSTRATSSAARRRRTAARS